MYKIFIRRGLSFAVGYPSPWIILRHGLSFAMGYPSPWVILHRGLSFAMGYPSPWVILRRGHITATFKVGSSRRTFSAAGSLHRRTGLQNTLLSLIINKLHIFLSSYFSVYNRGSKIIEHQNTFISKQLEILEW